MAPLLALLISGGSSVWVFTKLQNRTGTGNSKSAAQAAFAVFLVGFIVVFTIAKMIVH